MKTYAAVGSDGMRLVVWGLGGTPEEAIANARLELSEAGHMGAPGYDDVELTTHEVSDAQAAAIDMGAVEWPVTPAQLDIEDKLS